MIPLILAIKEEKLLTTFSTLLFPLQIATMAELEGDAPATDTQKRREILSRRPSYR